jgi:hypothetical protein
MDIEYKHIPQRQYLIDNIPAGKCGEWPGIKSNFWRGSIKVIQPIRKANKIFEDGELPIEKNRRHYPEKYGYEIPIKVKKRLYSAVDFKYEPKKEGLKAINFRPSIVKSAFNKKHFPQKFGQERIPFFRGIKTFYNNDNSKCRNEFSIEKEMGSKKRIWTIEQRRNGMKMRVPGDKFYRTSEQYATYFKDGGLIPGSTNTLNLNKTRSKKVYNFYDTLDLSVKVMNEDKFWDNKIKRENLEFDKNYVENTLKLWENNILSDFDPNYLKKKNENIEVDNLKKQIPKLDKKRKK